MTFEEQTANGEAGRSPNFIRIACFISFSIFLAFKEFKLSMRQLWFQGNIETHLTFYAQLV